VERIAIFAALHWECRAVVRQLRQVQRDRVGSFTRWVGRTARHEVWVVKTGVGIERAAAATSACDLDTAALIVSTGCGGGIASELHPGDLVVATHVLAERGMPALPTDAPRRAEAMRAATAAGLRGLEGPILCSTTALTNAPAKRAAAADGAVAVEMESVPIATRAAAAHIPFLSVRAILDGADHDLLPEAVMNPDSGGVRPLALVRHIATHPGMIIELKALQQMQRAASRSLERFFAAWFAALDASPQTGTR
jgi:nucleoside phosphorylase